MERTDIDGPMQAEACCSCCCLSASRRQEGCRPAKAKTTLEEAGLTKAAPIKKQPSKSPLKRLVRK